MGLFTASTFHLQAAGHPGQEYNEHMCEYKKHYKIMREEKRVELEKAFGEYFPAPVQETKCCLLCKQAVVAEKHRSHVAAKHMELECPGRSVAECFPAEEDQQHHVGI